MSQQPPTDPDDNTGSDPPEATNREPDGAVAEGSRLDETESPSPTDEDTSHHTPKAASRARRALAAALVERAAESQRIDRLLDRTAEWLATIETWSTAEPEATRIEQWSIRLSSYFRRHEARFARIRNACNQARYDDSYDLYLGRAAVYTGIAAIVGAVFGILLTTLFAVNGVFATIHTSATIPPEVGAVLDQYRVLFGGIFLTVVLAGITSGVTGIVLYYLPLLSRYQRRREIDRLLPDGVTYMYALSRGQLPLVRVVEVIAQSTGPYGGLAEEFQVIINEMEYRGQDLRRAMQTVRDRTASENLANFLNDLGTVLDSGGMLTPFLRDKTKEYHERARRNQERFLSVLEAIAQVYIIVQVVGVLLLVTLLTVIATISSGVLGYFYPVIYILIPGGTIAFMLLFDGLSIDESEATAATLPETSDTNMTANELEARADALAAGVAGDAPGSVVAANGGRDFSAHRSEAGATRTLKSGRNPERDQGNAMAALSREAITDSSRLLRELAHAKRRQRIRRILRAPFTRPHERPLAALGWSVPLALFVTVIVIGLGVASPSALETRPIWTTTLLGVLPIEIALIPPMLYHEARARRQKQINRELPDVVRQLASANEAGVPLTQAFAVVGETASGRIADEFQQLGSALKWNLSLEDGMRNLALRLRNPRFTRVANLLIESSSATGDLRAVLDAIEDDLRSALQLDRERRQSMLMYVFIGVLGFGVFLIIMAVLYSRLLTQLAAIQTAAPSGLGGGEPIGAAGPLKGGSVPLAQFQMLFYHAALLQGFFSGLVAGQLGHNHVLSGLKYALVFLLIAVTVFFLL